MHTNRGDITVLKETELSRGLRPLPLEFYRRDTFELVPEILGKLLMRNIRGKLIGGRIVEVEAYVGNDPASHAANGMTARNKVMFEAGGIAYVYFTYGMHFCFNIVTDSLGFPAALLVRAAEPIFGLDQMRKRRKTNDPYNLLSGPAKICQAMKIDKKLNGARLDSESLFIADDGFFISKKDIESSTRIGIAAGRKRNWRYFLKGNKFISKR